MPNKPRVPRGHDPREVEEWRIRLAADISEALLPEDVLGEDKEIVVTINTDGTITIGISDDYIPIPKTVVITSTDSPYSVLEDDEIVYCDTDGGDITVNLPAGVDGKYYKIVDSGSSDNTVSLTPDGTELLFGENTAMDIYDSEILEINYNPTEGWF